MRAVLLVIVLGWLIGRGLGWFGGGGEASDPNAASTRPAAAAAAAEPLAAEATTAVPPVGGVELASTRAETTAESAAVPLVEPAPSPIAESVPVPQLVPTIDADRFASMLSLVTHATEQRQFGSALASLQHLRSLPLDALQQAALVPAAREVERALSAVCGDLVQHLLQGQLLAGHRELVALLVDDGPPVRESVQQALQLAGLHVAVGRDRARGDVVLPIPRPLARGRAVRCLRDGELVVGRVVDSRSEAVTVRLANARGVTFPTISVVQCEPVDARTEEAIEMGFAALQHDEVQLARLWLALAQRSGGGEPTRLLQLVALLP